MAHKRLFAARFRFVRVLPDKLGRDTLLYHNMEKCGVPYVRMNRAGRAWPTAFDGEWLDGYRAVRLDRKDIPTAWRTT
jgi:hypothetical protein